MRVFARFLAALAGASFLLLALGYAIQSFQPYGGSADLLAAVITLALAALCFLAVHRLRKPKQRARLDDTGSSVPS